MSIKVNDYDKFAKSRQDELVSGEKKPHRFVEKPMMRSMLENLENKKVLMLGCGTGEESLMLRQFGATDLVGIDISKVSIDIAQKSYPESQFLVADMSKLPFKDDEFDYVYSSLAVHYTKDVEKVFKEVCRVLKKGGKFLFSVGHPLRWAVQEVDIDGRKSRVVGYACSNEENVVFGNYNTFGKHTHQFPNNEILSFYVGSPSMYFQLLKKQNFLIEDFKESVCVDEAKKVDYNYWYKYHEIPQFMAFLAIKK